MFSILINRQWLLLFYFALLWMNLNEQTRGGYFSQMLSYYLMAYLLKSLKSRPSFSQNFVKIFFIILGNFFVVWVTFLLKKLPKTTM